MTVEGLERLYDYGYWANRRLFAAVSQLSVEEFTQNMAGSYGSIRNTLVHILSAEWGRLDRCGGPARGAALKADDFPAPASLITVWKQVEAGLRTFLAELRDDDLVRVVEHKNPGGEGRSMALGELMQHGANHGVHHRGQVALLLRVLGHGPGNFDMIFYDAERHHVLAF
jgi:uncharacterized damage-inducible protein DinB